MPIARRNRAMVWAGLCVIGVIGCSRPSERGGDGADARQEAIRHLLDNGRYVEAQISADDALQLLERSGRGTSLASADALDLAVESRWRNGDASAAALSLAQQAVRLRRSVSPERNVAASLSNLGHMLLLAARPAEAIPLFESALTAVEKAFGADDLRVADALDSLAQGLIEQAQYAAADRHLSRSLGIRERGAPTGGPAIAHTLELMSFGALRAGQYGPARAPLNRAMTLRGNQGDHPAKTFTYVLLGDLSWLEGRPAAARDAYQRCVSIAERSLRPNHPDIAHCTKRLGNALARLGDVGAALPLLEKAREIAAASLGIEHPLYSGYLNDLAEVHRTLMDYRTARAYYEEGLAIRERRLGPDHEDLATIVFNLGLVSSELGDLAEARRHFARAIRIWSGRLGPNHPFVALTTASLAQTLLQHGRATEALPLQRRVLDMRMSTLGPEHRETADALGDLATTLLSLGQIDEAAAASERAIAIWERADTSDSLGFAAALRIRGDVLAATRDLPGARQRYVRALTLTERVLGPDHPSAAQLRVRIAGVAFQRGEVDEAFTEALVAERAARRFLESTLRYLPEREALRYAAARPTGLNLVISLASALVSRKDCACIRSALDSVIRNRALVLDAIATRSATPAGSADGALAALRTDWLSARQRLANLAVRADESLPPEAYHALLDDARREAERLERALSEKSAAFRADRDRRDVGLADVEAALPAGTALVSFVRYDRSLDTSARTGGGKPAISSYAAFVLRAGTEPVVVPLGPADRIDTDIGEWRNRAAAQPDARRPDLERETRRVGDKLRRRLWDPLEPHVRGAERILVVPDGALHLINLAALPVGESAYLIEGVPLIHYLTAERDIPHFAKGAPTTGRGLLALGGASFDAASAAAPPRPASVAPTDAGRATRSACGSLRSMQFSALPGTLGEVQDVARLWNQADQSASRSSHILTGTSASERAFKKDGPGKRVLHLATHGFFLGSQCSGRNETRAAGVLAHTSTVDRSSVDSESPLLQTGLALASANLRARATADDEDGILTGEEVAALNLEGTEWAVLSACDTGLGEVRNGEGVFGLRRAFQIAGVRSVIMSLWPVDDRVTRDWMVALYRARLERKLDTAESVRAASLEILRNRRAGRLSTNPLYWAGFVAAGDWK